MNPTNFLGWCFIFIAIISTFYEDPNWLSYAILGEIFFMRADISEINK